MPALREDRLNASTEPVPELVARRQAGQCSEFIGLAAQSPDAGARRPPPPVPGGILVGSTERRRHYRPHGLADAVLVTAGILVGEDIMSVAQQLIAERLIQGLPQ